MAFNMERWYSAAQARFSVRRYKGGPEADDLQALAGAAGEISGRGVRICLGQGADIFRPIFLGYGKITGTTHFAAFIAGPEATAHSIGYLGEAFILEATALGVGTCWLGGTYSKSQAIAALNLAPGERLAAITALGIPAETYAGRPRKSLAQLTGLSQAELQQLPEWQQSALSCARLAPSAINRQPWKFLPKAGGIEIRQAGPNFGFGGVDIGIAMLHMELGAAHGSVFGNWEERGNTQVFIPVG